MKVICIDDSGRPNEIPSSKWIKKGNEYTVVDAMRCRSQHGVPLAYVLAEVDIKGCGAYEGFDARRFSVPELDELLNQKQLQNEEV